METDKNMPGKKHEQDKRLKSFSEVNSLDRLSDEDAETASGITAGGDKALIEEDTKD